MNKGKYCDKKTAEYRRECEHAGTVPADSGSYRKEKPRFLRHSLVSVTPDF